MKKVADVVYCFDCEWIPCARTGRTLLGLPEDCPSPEVFEKLWARAGAKPEAPRPFLKLSLSEIVSISCIVRRRSTDGTVKLELVSYPALAGGQTSERQLITSFLEAVAGENAQLVGYNSAGADLPILIQRGIASRCRCPKFGQRPAKPWLGLDYFERFGEAHIDLARLLAAGGFGGAVTPSLHEIACACGIPGKLDHNGANVVDLWQGGHFAELTAYNETDACTTYLLWLRAANFQGLIPARELAQEVSAFRALIARRAAVRPEFARFQRAWTALDAPTLPGPGAVPAVQGATPGDGMTITVVARLEPPLDRRGGFPGSRTCGVRLDPQALDEVTRGKLFANLAPAGPARFRLVHKKLDPEGKPYNCRNREGGLILIPISSADPAGLVAAVEAIRVVDYGDVHSLDTA